MNNFLYESLLLSFNCKFYHRYMSGYLDEREQGSRNLVKLRLFSMKYSNTAAV